MKITTKSMLAFPGLEVISISTDICIGLVKETKGVAVKVTDKRVYHH